MDCLISLLLNEPKPQLCPTELVWLFVSSEVPLTWNAQRCPFRNLLKSWWEETFPTCYACASCSWPDTIVLSLPKDPCQPHSNTRGSMYREVSNVAIEKLRGQSRLHFESGQKKKSHILVLFSRHNFSSAGRQTLCEAKPARSNAVITAHCKTAFPHHKCAWWAIID